MAAQRQRQRSFGDLLSTEFVYEESGVKQYSPVKPACGADSTPQRAHRRLFGEGGGAGGLAGGSPTAVAGAPAFTASQPSSATSSLAAALADLQVSSRQSSAGDLGDRSRVLAFAAARGAPPPGPHSRSPSRGDGDGGEDGLCSPKLIGAVRCFDTMVLRTLTPIKTRSRRASRDGAPADDPSPPVAYADSLVSPFGGGLQPKGGPAAQPAARPVVFHARGSSGMAAPGAYNPYDLNAAALSAEFRSPAKSMYSPYPSSAASAATPPNWGSGSHHSASYRATAAAAALAQPAEEPDFYVSVPGVRRQQSGQGLGKVAPGGTPAKAPAQPPQPPQPDGATGAASPVPLQRHPSGNSGSGGPSLLRSVNSGATLGGGGGSGGAAHGFKGLFRSVVGPRA